MPSTAARCAAPPEQVSEDDVFNVSAACLLKHDKQRLPSLPHCPNLCPRTMSSLFLRRIYENTTTRPPGRPPIGFKGESIQVGVRERKREKTVSREPHLVQRWVPDEAVWGRCRLAWEMRRAGQSVLAIHQATRLFRSLNSYATFFTNRIYTGDFDYSGQCYLDFVPALIEREWFVEKQQCIAARAQKMQGKDTQPMVEPRRRSSPGLLSGKVFCGAVTGEEHPMHWHSAPARAGRAQWDSYNCSCRKRTHGERCRGQDVSARVLHQAVLDKIFSDILTRDNLRPLADELTQALHAQDATVSSQRQAIQDQLTKNQQALTRLLDSLEQADLPRPLVAERLTQRHAERSELLIQLHRLDERAIKPATLPAITDELIDDYIDKVRGALHGSDVALARRILDISSLRSSYAAKWERFTIRSPSLIYPRNGRLPRRGLGWGSFSLRQLRIGGKTRGQNMLAWPTIHDVRAEKVTGTLRKADATIFVDRHDHFTRGLCARLLVHDGCGDLRFVRARIGLADAMQRDRPCFDQCARLIDARIGR